MPSKSVPTASHTHAPLIINDVLLCPAFTTAFRDGTRRHPPGGFSPASRSRPGGLPRGFPARQTSRNYLYHIHHVARLFFCPASQENKKQINFVKEDKTTHGRYSTCIYFSSLCVSLQLTLRRSAVLHAL